MLDILIIILALLLILVGIYGFNKFKELKKNKKNKPEKKADKKKNNGKREKIKKEEARRKKEEDFDLKGANVDIAEKFLFRKEVKLLILINRILPKGLIVFPKVGVDLILTPIGNRTLYDSIHGKYVDLVIFEEDTMKPKLAIDLYDGTIGDEQLEVECPEVIYALKNAEFPIVSIKIKAEYEIEEIKALLLKGLGMLDKNEVANVDKKEN
ncbi:MAG: DUF2726 domain-containing protein [Clostridia bacterium]|nr:DUF2726 domain-containing protein [Clostridia bacterium]